MADARIKGILLGEGVIVKKIIYLAHYIDLKAPGNRNIIGSPAALNKMDYIIRVLSQLHIKTTVVSACNANSRRSNPAVNSEIYPDITLKLLPTLKCNKLLSRIVSKLYFLLQLIICLFKEVNHGDTLIVYHALSLIVPIKILKLFRKCHLIIEVEEIYGDVICNSKCTKKELRLFKKADGYLFATELLERKINVDKKPAIVVNGVYNTEPELKKLFKDDKIHVVYAGTLDPRKGGAIAASSALFLDERYHMHILGFGGEQEKKLLLNEIQRISAQSKCTITFDGCLFGEEYIQFLQSCDIGLSTQDPSAAFNATSFPSKILSYMSNGLRVVSVRIPAIEMSKVGAYLYYYDSQTPEEIAKAIMTVNIKDAHNGRDIVKRLNMDFLEELRNFEFIQ